MPDMETQAGAKTIYLVEEFATIREMMAEVLSMHQFIVVGSSGDGLKALEEIAKLAPDLVVLDTQLPSLNGMEMMRQLRKKNSPSYFLTLSAFSNSGIIRELLKIGVSGFVRKTAQLSTFLSAIDIVSKGGTYFCPDVSDMMQSAVSSSSETYNSQDILTRREKEILQYIAEGQSTKEIAATLGLSFKTVDNHRTNLMRKLDLHNVAQITRYAFRYGFVSLHG